VLSRLFVVDRLKYFPRRTSPDEWSLPFCPPYGVSFFTLGALFFFFPLSVFFFKFDVLFLEPALIFPVYFVKIPLKKLFPLDFFSPLPRTLFASPLSPTFDPYQEVCLCPPLFPGTSFSFLCICLALRETSPVYGWRPLSPLFPFFFPFPRLVLCAPI